MARFIFPEWTESLKKWINLLALGAPVYLIVLIAYGVTPEAIRIGYQPDQPVRTATRCTPVSSASTAGTATPRSSARRKPPCRRRRRA